MTDNTPVIVSSARTAIGRAGSNGAFRDMRADDLGAIAVQAATARSGGIDLSDVDELLVGCGQPAGEQGYGVGRAVAVLAGRNDLPAVTIQRYCASSLSAVRAAFHAIVAAESAVVVVAGIESISRYALGKADGMDGTRNPRFAEGNPEGLPDLYMPMGLTAEKVARDYGVSRASQDEFALLSQQRAGAATISGFLGEEIVPVRTPSGEIVDEDQSPRPDTTMERLAGLKPAFAADGTVTAGNSCPLNDGAAALVITTMDRARAHGLAPMAKIVGSSVSACSPETMGVAPIEATRRIFRRHGLMPADIDHVEINEAFAAQVIPCCRELGFDMEKVNPFGGAIALGHPFGMTGVRIVGTLIHGLQVSDGELGLATLCAAGGQAVAVVVERMN